ncbi:hypothetical protein NA56DRAFT_711889 [Hyaloscypha hepaticicola]|uniref:Uncharacterized protein n=1 Tax=Hyaloscypha hepaticicola TaxID=2082293 RepID=A0A2J6PHQ3_9HELO|nr:hypothetical protein NA56DRAFT_711889 [Hyaloscypha hepaticicola]
MEHSIPTFPPPAYHLLESQPLLDSHPRTSTTYEQLLLHIPQPQPQNLSLPEVRESKWARRSLSPSSHPYIYHSAPHAPSSPCFPQESDWARNSSDSRNSTAPGNYTESLRNFKRESKRKLILFAVAVLVLFATLLAVVGATTHFRAQSSGCTAQYSEVNDNWVCV